MTSNKWDSLLGMITKKHPDENVYIMRFLEF